MPVTFLLADKIDWGNVPTWISLFLMFITIVAASHHVNRQPKELIEPIVTVDKPRDDKEEYFVKFWALNKSNIPVTVEFFGLRLAQSNKKEYDRLGKKLEFKYLQAGEKSEDYCFNLKAIKKRFGENVENKKLIFCFRTADGKYIERKIKLNDLEEKLR